MSWNELRKGRCSQAEGEYFITFTTHKRQALFKCPRAASIFCRLLAENEQKTGSHWFAWTLMPDHFHGLLKLGQDYTLSEVMRDLKGRSACALNRELSLRGSRWQPAYFERALRFDESRIAIARYIIANPLRAGIVDTIGDYPYWNADYL